MLWKYPTPASLNADEHLGPAPRSLRFDWTPTLAPTFSGNASDRRSCSAPLPIRSLTGEPTRFNPHFASDGTRARIGF